MHLSVQVSKLLFNQLLSQCHWSLLLTKSMLSKHNIISKIRNAALEPIFAFHIVRTTQRSDLVAWSMER